MAINLITNLIVLLNSIDIVTISLNYLLTN